MNLFNFYKYLFIFIIILKIIIKKKELKNHKINHAFNNLKQKCLKSI